jgi:NAD(P)-dependent dehydrogenase (short-subunit alcohol dehydrogenase family)
MTSFGLVGKVVMVTGGASGIGKAVVELAAREGCKVAIADVNAAAAERCAETVVAGGGTAMPFLLDVRDSAATENVVDAIEGKLGPIYGLVTSAGVSRPALAEDMPYEKWSVVLDTNLTGTFLSCQAVGRRMLPRRLGSIVVISSVDGLGGHAARTNYAASKFGLDGLVRSLAIDWGRHGIRVNAVAPGIVDTPLLRANIAAEHIEEVMLDRTPLGRLSTGEDQAQVCFFLLSEAARYVTGVVLPVDGGLTAGFFTRLHGADFGSPQIQGSNYSGSGRRTTLAGSRGHRWSLRS